VIPLDNGDAYLTLKEVAKALNLPPKELRERVDRFPERLGPCRVIGNKDQDVVALWRLSRLPHLISHLIRKAPKPEVQGKPKKRISGGEKNE